VRVNIKLALAYSSTSMLDKQYHEESLENGLGKPSVNIPNTSAPHDVSGVPQSDLCSSDIPDTKTSENKGSVHQISKNEIDTRRYFVYCFPHSWYLLFKCMLYYKQWWYHYVRTSNKYTNKLAEKYDFRLWSERWENQN
jgi:hypothetical protein